MLPTVEEICTEFGLNDVKIQYRDVDYQNLINYKYFTKHVSPILAKENPKVRFHLFISWQREKAFFCTVSMMMIFVGIQLGKFEVL